MSSPAQSMYQASVPTLTRMLKNIRGLLEKAQQHAQAQHYEPAVLLAQRLYPDMYPLLKQVQIVCDTAKGCVARLSGTTAPVHADTETTFDELYARIDKVLAYVANFTPAQLDGSEARAIELKFGPTMTIQYDGLNYLNQFVMGNLYFHCSMAYAILRHNGVPLGKADFIGR